MSEITPGRSPAGSSWRWGLLAGAICLAVSAIASIPYFFIARPLPGQSQWDLRMPGTHDMYDRYDQMRSFYAGLASGEIYPRWEEDTNRGFGAPTTSFYPPGVYYVTALSYVLSRDWTRALLIAQWLMMFASGLAVYWYARRLMGRPAAMVAMAAYLLGPYHLLDQYQRGAIAELLGFIWMPLMLGAGEQLLKASGENRRDSEAATGREESRPKNGRSWRLSPVLRQRVIWTLVLGLSFGAFVWSHPPTAYQFTLGFAAGMLVLAAVRREWRGLIWAGAGLALGLGLAAAYIVPAVLEQSLINSDNVTHDYPYHDSYVLVRLGVNAGKANAFLDRIDHIWLFDAGALLAAAAALFVLCRWSRAPWRFLRDRVVLWTILGALALFMMTGPSAFIGRYIPGIEIGIFTWRMLGILTLATALMFGALTEVAGGLFPRFKIAGPIIAGAVAVLVIGSSAWLSLEDVVKPYSDGTPFSPPAEHFNYAFMPRSAYGDLFHLPVVGPAELESGNGSVSVEQWAPQHRRIHVEIEKPDRVLFRTSYFPGWTVTVDGKEAEIESAHALRIRAADGNEALIRELKGSGRPPSGDGPPTEVIEEVSLGDIAVPVGPGVHEIRLDYRPTAVRRAAGVATVLCFGLVGITGLAIAATKSVYA